MRNGCNYFSFWAVFCSFTLLTARTDGRTDRRSGKVNTEVGAPPKNNVLNKFYIVFHLLSLCVFMSIQNIGRSIHLTTSYLLCLNVFITTLDRYLANAK